MALLFVRIEDILLSFTDAAVSGGMGYRIGTAGRAFLPLPQ
jgi:hypothetical protein